MRFNDHPNAGFGIVDGLIGLAVAAIAALALASTVENALRANRHVELRGELDQIRETRQRALISRSIL